MKKHLYFFLFFFTIYYSAGAQIKKGDLLLGLNFGFLTSKYNNSDPASWLGKGHSVALFPSFGKAIKDNLIAGAYLSWSGMKSTQEQGNNSAVNKYNNYGAGLFLRRYKMLGKGFSYFLQGRLGGLYANARNQRSDNAENDSDNKGYSVILGLSPGVVYRLGRCIFMEAGFNDLIAASYSHSKNELTNPGTRDPILARGDGFSFSTGLNSSLNNISFGLRCLLN